MAVGAKPRAVAGDGAGVDSQGMGDPVSAVAVPAGAQHRPGGADVAPGGAERDEELAAARPVAQPEDGGRVRIVRPRSVGPGDIDALTGVRGTSRRPVRPPWRRSAQGCRSPWTALRRSSGWEGRRGPDTCPEVCGISRHMSPPTGVGGASGGAERPLPAQSRRSVRFGRAETLRRVTTEIKRRRMTRLEGRNASLPAHNRVLRLAQARRGENTPFAPRFQRQAANAPGHRPGFRLSKQGEGVCGPTRLFRTLGGRKAKMALIGPLSASAENAEGRRPARPPPFIFAGASLRPRGPPSP